MHKFHALNHLINVLMPATCRRARASRFFSVLCCCSSRLFSDLSTQPYDTAYPLEIIISPRPVQSTQPIRHSVTSMHAHALLRCTSHVTALVPWIPQVFAHVFVGRIFPQVFRKNQNYSAYVPLQINTADGKGDADGKQKARVFMLANF